MATRYYTSQRHGSSALGASLSISGMDEYLERIKAAGNSVEQACVAAVNAALPIVEADMKAGAERHIDSGAVVDAIEITPAVQKGHGAYGWVGIDMDRHPEAIHGVYQEYGDGHTLCFPDPFVRPAFDNNKSKVKAAEKAELEKWGVPTE